MGELSPERAGRITGSRVAAVLGLDPYRTRADVMREMVRQLAGAEQEFTGNAATDWGTEHEADALAAFEESEGLEVADRQRFCVSDDGMLAATVDGTAYSQSEMVAVVEAKCPYAAMYTSLKERPAYGAQIQLQLAVTGLPLAYFVVWRPNRPVIVEPVPADPWWLPTHLPALRAFKAELDATMQEPVRVAEHLAPPFASRDDDEWSYAAGAWRRAKERHDAAKHWLDICRADLEQLADGRSSVGGGVQVLVSSRTGSVDYRAAAEQLAAVTDSVDFETYRAAPSLVTRITVTSEDS